MLKHFYILLFPLMHFSTFAQRDTLSVKYEVGLSCNYSTVADENTYNEYGYGAFLHYIILNNRKVNGVMGFEYNCTGQKKDRVYEKDLFPPQQM